MPANLPLTRFKDGNMDISIVVPFFNSQRYIESCIEGLVSQSYPYRAIGKFPGPGARPYLAAEPAGSTMRRLNGYPATQK